MTPETYKDESIEEPCMSILDIRDAMNDLADLVDVIRVSLLASEADINPAKVSGCLYFYVYQRIKELEKELAKQ